MIKLFASVNATDVEALIEALKSWPDEQRELWGVVERRYYHVVGESRVIVVNTYNTLEEAQKHKANVASPEVWDHFEQLGAKPPVTLWIAEEA